MSAETFEGGCLCGALRYRAQGPVQSSSTCFCTSCRRASGASPVAWFVVGLDQFQLLQGSFSSYRSSPKVLRDFCGRCGTPIAYRHDDEPQVIELTTASLDDPARMPPEYEIWHADRIAWVASDPALPHFPKSADGND
jgi:hypothetical protein